ncbi:MAG: cytochrome-c peroxidase [Pirellulales bacterium]
MIIAVLVSLQNTFWIEAAERREFAPLPLVPPALAAGVAPPLPFDGPLAAPRSENQVGLPIERTKRAIPVDNPQSPERIALGRVLFLDARLSADGSVACASCHDPERAFTDGRPTSIGIHGRAGQRNSPTVLNALYNKTQFWDGRAATLEEQALLPITNPDEMGQPDLNTAVKKIAHVAQYDEAFHRIFGRPVNGDDLGRAIAAYERSLISFDSPFDRFIAGDRESLSESAQRGWELFNTPRSATSATHKRKQSAIPPRLRTTISTTSGLALKGIASYRLRSRLRIFQQTATPRRPI